MTNTPCPPTSEPGVEISLTRTPWAEMEKGWLPKGKSVSVPGEGGTGAHSPPPHGIFGHAKVISVNYWRLSAEFLPSTLKIQRSNVAGEDIMG